MKKGFTIIEMILVIGSIALVTAGSVFLLTTFLQNTQLNATVKEIVQSLRKANSNAVSRLHDNPWGIKFDDAQKQFTFFSGKSFAERNPQNDILFKLSSSILFEEILEGGSKEIVFRKTDGQTNQYGTIKLKDNSGGGYLISVNKWGQIDINKL